MKREIHRNHWPTYLLAFFIYASWAGLIVAHQSLAWWILYPALLFVVTLQCSFQHECCHYHPGGHKVSTILGYPSLYLWMPFELFRKDHLTHHNDHNLTHPDYDPESWYYFENSLESKNIAQQALFHIRSYFIGRMIVAPLVFISFLIRRDLPKIFTDKMRREIWAKHFIVIGALLGFLAYHQFNILYYVLFVCWPATSLLCVRSFFEHAYDADSKKRSVIIEGKGLMGFLFLFNNYHIVHHEKPNLPWYKRHTEYYQNKAYYDELNGGFHYPSYGQAIKVFLFKKKDLLMKDEVGNQWS